MASVISWFELPATDLARATGFYRAVLGSRFEAMDGYDTGMFFAHDGDGVGGEICVDPRIKPSSEGVRIYLDAPNGVTEALGKVEAAGGKVVMGVTEIGPHGHIAHIIDTEGNCVGLHSMSR